MEIILCLITFIISIYIGYNIGYDKKYNIKMDIKGYQSTIESLTFELNKARNEVESLKQFLNKESK